MGTKRQWFDGLAFCVGEGETATSNIIEIQQCDGCGEWRDIARAKESWINEHYPHRNMKKDQDGFNRFTPIDKATGERLELILTDENYDRRFNGEFSDINGNVWRAERAPCGEGCFCDAVAYPIKTENPFKEAGDIVGGRFDDNIALKLRFVLLGDSVVMQVKDRDVSALGYNQYNLPTKSPIIEIMSPHKVCHFQKADFEEIKQILTEFVENNCFLGNEKPLPRIERTTNESNLDDVLFGDGITQRIDKTAIDLLLQTGVDLPIYEGKPRFTSEWKKIYPREFTTKDLPQMFSMQSPYDSDLRQVVGQAGVIKDVLNQSLTYLNKKESEFDVEIWEFTIYAK